MIIYIRNESQITVKDAIYVLTNPPPTTIKGVGTGVVGVATQCDWGPQNVPLTINVSTDIQDNFGYFSEIETQLTNLQFATLYVVRASSIDDITSSADLISGATIFALYPGAGGNNVQYQISDATDEDAEHFNLSVKMVWTSLSDTNTSLTQNTTEEVYQNVDFTTPEGVEDFINAVTGKSLYIEVDTITATTRPTNIAYTALTGGETGDPVLSEWTTALDIFATSRKANIVTGTTATTGTDIINTALYQHVQANQNRMAVLVVDHDLDTALSQITQFRDASGRYIAVADWTQKINTYGQTRLRPMNMIVASTLSQTGVSINPSYVANSFAFAGVQELVYVRDIPTYNSFDEAGIMCAEYLSDLGVFHIYNGVTTQIAIPDLRMVAFRRTEDYLTQSVSTGLLNFQGGPNTYDYRNAAGQEVSNFLAAELTNGLIQDYRVDAKTLNTPEYIATQSFGIIVKVQITGSMRTILINWTSTFGTITTTATTTPETGTVQATRTRFIGAARNGQRRIR